ncbi:hypothetical protein [Embleya sp. MST-111070]|uniref:hypothetical protein n=1 Tax=Embleya sp. MST-111070 TaxID=3398231 RepID=UPI003F73A05F
MTKAGSDHLKHTAREIVRATGSRFPDVLVQVRRELSATPQRQPSKELVPRCPGLAHPIDGGRCARPAGHHGSWSWCSSDPHLPSHIWKGYHSARDEADRARHQQWLDRLGPRERTEYEAEQEAEYWSQLADEMREPYDPYEDEYRFAEDGAPDDAAVVYSTYADDGCDEDYEDYL